MPSGGDPELWEGATRAPHGKAVKKCIPARQDLPSCEGNDMNWGQMWGEA